ncbi:MAG: YggT family protein [Corynebacterium sp.]|nr:YggT family protein [Corynebacterium sp.]
MSLVVGVLVFLLQLYLYILVARILIEMIGSFSRQFRPPRWFSVISEPLFVVTDPPVKALRKIIPPLSFGGVGLDVSVIVLFLLIEVAIMLVSSLA